MSDKQIQLQISESSSFNTTVVDKTVEYSGEGVLVQEEDIPSIIDYGDPLYSRIRHRNNEGNSGWSKVVTFIIRELWDDFSSTIQYPSFYNMGSWAVSRHMNNEYVMVFYGGGGGSTPDYYYPGLYAQMLYIDGTTVTASDTYITIAPVQLPEETPGSSPYYFHALEKITPTTALCAYEHGSGLKHAYLKITNMDIEIVSTLDIPRSDIPSDVDPAGRINAVPTILKLGPSKVIITLGLSDTKNSEAAAYILSINPTTLTLSRGPINSLPGYKTRNARVYTVDISASQVLTTFINSGDNNRIYMGILNIDGNEIVALPPVRCTSHSAHLGFRDRHHVAFQKLDDVHAMVYHVNKNDNYCPYITLITFHRTHNANTITPVIGAYKVNNEPCYVPERGDVLLVAQYIQSKRCIVCISKPISGYNLVNVVLWKGGTLSPKAEKRIDVWEGTGKPSETGTVISEECIGLMVGSKYILIHDY